MSKTPRQKNHREANNKSYRFSPKFRLPVAFVLGLVASGIAVNKSSGNDADQPNQPGITDTISPGTDGDGPKPPKKPDEKEYECPEFTDEIIERAIEEGRENWEQFMREPKPEPKVLSPHGLKDVLEDILGDALDKESYDRMIELLDTEEILREAENSGSEAIKNAVTRSIAPFEEFKDSISTAESRYEKIRIFAEFLCDLILGYSIGYLDVLEMIESFHCDEVMALNDEDWSEEEIKQRIAKAKEIINNNPALKRFANQELLNLSKESIDLDLDIDSENDYDNCIGYIMYELYYKDLYKEEDEE